MTAKAGPDAAPAEDDVLVRCLGDFVRHFMGPVTVVRGYTNRVTKPACPDYVLITPMAAARLATNLHLWHADKDALSSPRPWGCFRFLVLRQAQAQVFPTPVGVFL